MPQLQRITIDLTESTLPNEAFQTLVQNLIKIAKPVEELSVRLRGSSITNKQLIALLEASKHIASTNLWKMIFDVAETKVTDTVFPKPNELLTKTSKLENLYFIFTNCSNRCWNFPT